MQTELTFEGFLREKSYISEGSDYALVPYHVCRDLAKRFGLTWLDAEIAALNRGVCPSRYERNIGTIGIDGQVRLLRSRVAVVGLGGLGGFVVDLLARAGVGHLKLIDGDDFSENNLNRQLLCTEADIGRSKAEVAFERVRVVNGALDVDVVGVFIEDDEDAAALLAGMDVVIDALDNNASRKLVSDWCRGAGVPFIHGAIGGLWAQVGVFCPGDRTPWEDPEDLPDRGVELAVGNPPFTPAFTAALQAALAVEVITGIVEVHSGVLHWFDLGEVSMRHLRV